MRYYLDTNILIFVLMKDEDNIDKDVKYILNDYSNRFYVSSVVMQELIIAFKTESIRDVRHKCVNDLFDSIEELGIKVVLNNKHHLIKYAELETTKEHKDPNDHLIISQAISDKIPIISSDRKFKAYRKQGLEFIFNKR